MRSLAAELGVEAMSLYRHVDSKEALLDGVAEQLMGEIEPRGVSSDWAEAVRGFASSVRGLAREHPQAFTLLGMRALASASALQPVEDLLASLRAGGVHTRLRAQRGRGLRARRGLAGSGHARRPLSDDPRPQPPSRKRAEPGQLPRRDRADHQRPERRTGALIEPHTRSIETAS